MSALVRHRAIYVVIACGLAMLAGSALIVAFLPRSATSEGAGEYFAAPPSLERLMFTHPLLDQSPRAVSAFISPPDATHTLKISELTALFRGQTLEQVHVNVRNHANTPIGGYVWFIVSRMREQPWQSAVYAAPEQRVRDLLPGANASYQFEAPEGLIGDYYLSAWVHKSSAGQRQHADGVSLPEPLALALPFTFVSDAPLPAPATYTQPVTITRDFSEQTFVISAISTTQTARSLHQVRVTVVNISDAPRTGYVWFTLAPPNSEQPWRTAIYTAPEQQIIDLVPGARFEAVFELPNQLMDGEWQLSAWAHGVNLDGQRYHSDGASYLRPIVIGKPLDFTLIDARIGSTLETIFAIRNNMDRATTITVFYTLSPPDDLMPWNEPAFATVPALITLLPGEQYTWTTAQPLDLPQGDYRLIGWLHERHGELYRLMAAQMHHELLVIGAP